MPKPGDSPGHSGAKDTRNTEAELQRELGGSGDPSPAAGGNGADPYFKITADLEAEVAERWRVEESLRQERDFNAAILETIAALVVVLDREGRIVLFNKACEAATGYAAREMQGRFIWDGLLLPEDVERTRQVFLALTEGAFPSEDENIWVAKDGARRLIAWSNTCVVDPDGKVEFVIGTGLDVTEPRRAETLRSLNNEVFSAMASGADLDAVLEVLVKRTQAAIPGLLCSVLLVDETGRKLRHGCAPDLPDFYNEAVDGIAIGPGVGSCGAAAHSGERVVVEDVMTHPNWQDFRALAERAGLRACWSEPLISSGGHVLGTLAMYYRDPREPEAENIAFIEGVAHLARIAIERSGAERAIRESKAQAKAAERLLRDAIASISEGFVLYDAEDRLVLCNSKWMDLYGYSASEVQPGIKYEDLVRLDLELGAIAATEADYHDRRIDYRRRFEGSFDVQLADGRWITIRERKTSDGGIVGVQTDITERKRAEEALRESERRLARAQEQAKIGYWSWSLGEEGMTYVSGQYCAILGLTHDQTPTRQGEFNRYIHPEDRKRVEAFFREVSTKPRDYEIDYRIVRPDGEVCNVVEIGELTYGDDNVPNGHTGTLQDITTLKRAEAALRVSEARLRAVIEHSPADIHLSDAEGRYILVNRQFEEWYGFGDEEARDKLPHEFFPAEFADTFVGHCRAVIESGQAVTMEDQAPFDDGLHTFLTVRFPVPGAPGEGTVVGTISSDITDRKRAEDAVRESEGRFRSVVDNSPSSVLLKDAEGRYLLVNKRFEEWYGLEAEQVLGKTAFDLFAPEFAESLWALDREVLEAGEPTSQEHEIPFADGTLHTVFVTKFPVYVGGGASAAVGSVTTDITELKQRETALIAAKQEAELANRAKSEFLANMSHELRTPLNAVIGFAELIASEAFGPVGNERYRDHAGEIEAAGRDLLKMINDVLELAKIEAGKLQLYEREVDVPAVVDSCLVLAGGRAHHAGLSLEAEVPEDLPLLWADERMLKQMLTSILSNAIKFTPSGGRLKVAVSAGPGQGHTFEISDSGIGMSLEDIPKAMVHFGQIDGRHDKKFAGTGLGLPLAKSLVELHGGSLDLESELGQGTRVTLRFPAGRVLPARRDATCGSGETCSAEGSGSTRAPA
jgi:PAS domain S-box-containing protein